MSDAPLTATSEKLPGGIAGWSASLEPDARFPEHERTWWIIDAKFFGAYVKLDLSTDDDLRYEQFKWAVEAHAAAGNLLLGHEEDDYLWSVIFPDGSTAYGYVVNYWNVEDLRKECLRIEYEDWNGPRTRPYDADLGRWAGSRRHDEWGRVRTGLAEHFHQ
jgi:hypothetical protein